MSILNRVKNLFVKDKSYEEGLAKTRKNLIEGLNFLSNKYKVLNDEYFEGLEELLISADLGVNTTIKFVERLKERVKKEHITDISLLDEIIVDELFIIYINNQIIVNKINYSKISPSVILVVGVNGVGKTTSIAKLGYKLKSEGKKVLLIAADTFRAGAVNQLHEWGLKLDIEVFIKETSDPAAVVYDGINYAKDNNFDIVLVDTAGRLQNKENLMQELGKINKVIISLVEKVSETLLVIDASTGQNGISQAKQFKSIVDITGIILTKIDGTAKGGIVLAIKDEVDIPVKFIGLGEKKEDLKVFDIENYIYNLVKEDKDA
jgi:fused signal recognition particle receptor